ncbi:MAG: hypothetical protein IKG21_12140 [Atopobiaceae bacterium]|nr:hypothetical protein [Atopobiaceae bacterium]
MIAELSEMVRFETLINNHAVLMVSGGMMEVDSETSRKLVARGELIPLPPESTVFMGFQNFVYAMRIQHNWHFFFLRYEDCFGKRKANAETYSSNDVIGWYGFTERDELPVSFLQVVCILLPEFGDINHHKKMPRHRNATTDMSWEVQLRFWLRIALR